MPGSWTILQFPNPGDSAFYVLTLELPSLCPPSPLISVAISPYTQKLDLKERSIWLIRADRAAEID